MVLLSFSIHLLIFWQVILPVIERGILMYLTMFLDLSLFFLVLVLFHLFFSSVSWYMDLTEAEDIKKRWQEHTEEL